ncbi:MAG: prolyl oligopeptidase family serine peptidase [Pseudomonadota bacterium]
MTLTGPSRPAASGNATSHVIFLHGYGADGADLLGLAEPLAPYLLDTAFFAPNAPERSSLNPMGYQWFPIPRMDGSTEAQAVAGMQASAAVLNGWLDGLIAESGVGAARTVLVGFSQGTMISLEVAPRRAEAFAGVVGFSGRLVTPERLAGEVVSRPPILLIHGDMDDVVPPSSLPEAADALVEAGFSVQTHISPGMAHGIAQDGLGLALGFIRDNL